MNATEIMAPSGLSRIVDGLFAAVRLGLAGLRRGGAYFNAPAGRSLSLLNRLTHILRAAFVILALHVEVAPLRARAPSRTARLRRVRLYRPGFRMFAPMFRLVDIDAPKHPQPAAFARAARDPYLAATRKAEALARALADPMPVIRRMARRLPTRLMVFGWRPPKRPPPLARRDFYDQQLEGWREARFALSEWRRRRSGIGETASAP